MEEKEGDEHDRGLLGARGSERGREGASLNLASCQEQKDPATLPFTKPRERDRELFSTPDGAQRERVLGNPGNPFRPGSGTPSPHTFTIFPCLSFRSFSPLFSSSSFLFLFFFFILHPSAGSV